MAYYDALVAKWGTLSVGTSIGSIQSAITTINGASIAGPAVNVPATSVVGYLALNGKLTNLQAYAAAGTGSSPIAILAAKEFVTLMGISGMVFQMTVPATATAIQNFLEAMTLDSGTGITATDVTAILALSTPPVLWTTAPVLLGGGGLNSAIVNSWDLLNAGLITADQAEAIG